MGSVILVVMKRRTGLILLFLSLVACTSSGPDEVSPSPLLTSASPVQGEPIRISITADGARCTFTAPSDVVQPGEELGGRFTLTNTTDAPLEIVAGVGAGTLRYYDADGRLVADTWSIMEGAPIPSPSPQQLRPGQSTEVSYLDTPIMWASPLRVVPVCQGKPMVAIADALAITVATEGVPPSGQSQLAIDRAIEASGGVFANCRPLVGESVVGAVHAPKGDRTITARCEAVILPRPGFDVVVLAAITPVSAPPINVAGIANDLSVNAGMALPKVTAMSWMTFVVTGVGAAQIAHRSAYECQNRSGGGEFLATCGPQYDSG